MFLHSTGKHLQYPYVPDPDPTFIIQIMDPDPHHCCTVFYWYLFLFFCRPFCRWCRSSCPTSSCWYSWPSTPGCVELWCAASLLGMSTFIQMLCAAFTYRLSETWIRYFTNKACLGHLCRKKFHFYFWSFQRYCKTIFSIQNTHVWNVELLITCAVHWSTLMGVIFVTQIIVKCTSIIVSIHFFSQKKLNYVLPGRNFTFFYDET